MAVQLSRHQITRVVSVHHLLVIPHRPLSALGHRLDPESGPKVAERAEARKLFGLPPARVIACTEILRIFLTFLNLLFYEYDLGRATLCRSH